MIGEGIRKLCRRRRLRRESGQTGTEFLLVISVVTVSLVGGAYTVLPSVQAGVHELSRDVQTILSEHNINVGTPAAPSTAPRPGTGAASRGSGAAPPIAPSAVPGAQPQPAPYISLPSHATVTPVGNRPGAAGAAGGMIALAFLLAGMAYISGQRQLTAAEEAYARSKAAEYAAMGGDRATLDHAFEKVSAHGGDVEAAMSSPQSTHAVFTTTEPPAGPQVIRT